MIYYCNFIIADSSFDLQEFSIIGGVVNRSSRTVFQEIGTVCEGLCVLFIKSHENICRIFVEYFSKNVKITNYLKVNKKLLIT